MSRPASRASGRTSSMGMHSSQSNRPLGGLSAKQYEQIASNISSASSARKPAASSSNTRPSLEQRRSYASRPPSGSERGQRLSEESEEDTIPYSKMGKAVFAQSSKSQSTLTAGTAFADAPLNPRVPPASPRRVAPQASSSKHAHTDVPKAENNLRGVDPSIQEALLVEDLLSVLTVRLFTSTSIPSSLHSATGHRRPIHYL